MKLFHALLLAVTLFSFSCAHKGSDTNTNETKKCSKHKVKSKCKKCTKGKKCAKCLKKKEECKKKKKKCTKHKA